MRRQTKMPNNTRVFVTGVGVVSPVGIGVDGFWSALTSGQSGADKIVNFDSSDLERHHACEVKDFRPRDHLSSAEARRMGRCAAMTVAAAREAVAQANLDTEKIANMRSAVFIGTTMGEANVLGELEAAWIHQGKEAVSSAKLPRYGTTLLPIHVARAFHVRGTVQTLPAACAAGNYAIGFGADYIRSGRADIAITGASEVIEKLQFAGFCRLGAVSNTECKPFDVNRDGLFVGEGSGVLILESEASVVKRGIAPLAEVGGYGLACDAHHITRPHPEGAGSELALRRAIVDSGLKPDDVDFVNAHGTATPANDLVEGQVIRRVFGERDIPVTSNKSMLGHCMGAASAIEAVSCIRSLQTGLIPPTINHRERDPECDINVMTELKKLPKIRTTLNNSLAFGGYDAALLLAQTNVLPPPSDINASERAANT